MTLDIEVLLQQGTADGMTVLPAAPPADQTPGSSGGALEILALAQRTADSHIAEANRHVRKVRAEAQVLAEQIHRDACSYAAEVRAEADKVLAGAHAEAERVVADGNDRADQLKLRAQQRYEDAVGGLSVKREALQNQIEALASFDNDYRYRITSFLQKQLRALWAEHPEAFDALDLEFQVPGGPVDSFVRS